MALRVVLSMGEYRSGSVRGVAQTGPARSQESFLARLSCMESKRVLVMFQYTFGGKD
jgi:hypothetical protein